MAESYSSTSHQAPTTRTSPESTNSITMIMSSPSAIQTILQRPVMQIDPTENEMGDNDPTQALYDIANRDAVLVGLIHTMGLVLALIGNCSVIFIIARTKKLHTPSSLLVLVLAVSDLLLSLFWNLVPLLLTFHEEVNRMLLESDVACNVVGFAWETMLTISTLSHSVVALDRYLFIVHPMKYQVYVNVKATSLLSCLIVFVAFLLSTLTLITWSDFRFRHTAGMCIGSPVWAVLYLFLIFIPSLSIAIFAYHRIWRLCVSIFKQEDTTMASRGHSPYPFDQAQLPPLSHHSSKSPSRCDPSEMEEDLKMTEKSDLSSYPQQETTDCNQQNETLTQQNILTMVTTHLTTTKIIRKNTTTTTTIANTGSRSGSQPGVPIEDPETDHEDDVYRKRTTEHRKVSTVTEIEVEETKSTCREKKRTRSVTFHTSCPVAVESLQSNPQAIMLGEMGVSLPIAESSSRTPVSSGGGEPAVNRTRAHSKISTFSLLTPTQKRQGQNPFIVTTSAGSLSSISNMDVNLSATNKNCPTSISRPQSSAHLSIIDQLPRFVTPPQQPTSYETVTKKLFGSEAFLPSLLYVAILMPLSMQPASSIYKHRRLKVCLLIGLPVLIMAVSFLPFPGSLIYLGYVHAEDTTKGAGMFVIKLICHLTYALVPSLTSLLLCLNNKPYRRALGQTCRCRCV